MVLKLFSFLLQWGIFIFVVFEAIAKQNFPAHNCQVNGLGVKLSSTNVKSSFLPFFVRIQCLSWQEKLIDRFSFCIPRLKPDSNLVNVQDCYNIEPFCTYLYTCTKSTRVKKGIFLTALRFYFSTLFTSLCIFLSTYCAWKAFAILLLYLSLVVIRLLEFPLSSFLKPDVSIIFLAQIACISCQNKSRARSHRGNIVVPLPRRQAFTFRLSCCQKKLAYLYLLFFLPSLSAASSKKLERAGDKLGKRARL